MWKNLFKSIIVTILSLMFFSFVYLVVQDVSFNVTMENLFIDIFDYADSDVQKIVLSKISRDCADITRHANNPEYAVYINPCVHYVNGMLKAKDTFVRLFLDLYPYDRMITGKGWVMKFEQNRPYIMISIISFLLALMYLLYVILDKNYLSFMYQLSWVFSYAGIHFTIFPLAMKLYLMIYKPNTTQLLLDMVSQATRDSLNQEVNLILPIVFSNLFPTLLLLFGIIFFILGIFIRRVISKSTKSQKL